MWGRRDAIKLRRVVRRGPAPTRLPGVAVLSHEGTYSIMYGAFPVPVGSGYRRGYGARPDKAGRYPTVIVVPGIDGTTANEKSFARGLARRGIAAVVVDLYSSTGTGRSGLDSYNSLDDGEALRSLDETAGFLESPDVDWSLAQRVGVLGFDVGGRFALITAAHRQWVAAAAVVSTPLTGDEHRRFPIADMLAHLAVPVLGLYGANDSLIAVETIDEAQSRNGSGSWLLYDGAGHAFYDEAADEFDPAAAADATARLTGFFAQTLPAAVLAELG